MKKLWFNKIFICFMIVITMFVFTGCGGNNDDDKLVNTSGEEVTNAGGSGSNDVFKEKEFTKILSAINYANKICSNYSYKVEGTGKLESNVVTEQISTKIYVSKESNKKMTLFEAFNISNSNIGGDFGILIEELDNYYLYCEDYKKQNNRIAFNGEYYWRVLKVEQQTEFLNSYVYLPGEQFCAFNVNTIGNTLVDITKKSNDYYFKFKLKPKGLEKLLKFASLSFNGNATITLKDCNVEVYLDKYARFKQINYELFVDCDATAVEGINATINATIKLSENYSNYNDLSDFTPRLILKHNS